MQSIYDINDTVKVITADHEKHNKSGTVTKTWSGDSPCCLVLIDNEHYILDDTQLLLV